MDNDFADAAARRLLTTEKGHGREEIRSYLQMPVPLGLADVESWKGRQTIGVVTSVCLRDGKETIETRYDLSSLRMGVKRFASAVRSHWRIETSCPWSLDVTFREDESRIGVKQRRENVAWLNRFRLSLLKQHPSKDSIVMRRRGGGWDENFLLQVLTGATL